MDVSSTGGIGGAVPIRPTQMTPTPEVTSTPVSGLELPQDEVEISSAARMLDQMQHDPQVRAERLAEIRTAIQAGTYDSPEKLEMAVERLLSRIARDEV